MLALRAARGFATVAIVRASELEAAIPRRCAMRRGLSLFALALAALSATSVQAQTRETQQHNLDRYLQFAGAPIDEFPFWSLYQWELVGPDQVVVWSTVNKAYLVKVEQPCAKLEWAHSVAVTSNQRHRVSRTFDFVIAEGERCKIDEIRPIDYAAMRKQAREDKAKS
jgi:hypothetical protein